MHGKYLTGCLCELSLHLNSLILGLVKCGQGQKALSLSRKMQQEGMEPDAVTFVGILNACACVMALQKGRCVHEQIAQSGFESNVFVGNSLVDMYAKFGSIEDAWRVSSRMPMRNVVAWTAIILDHVKCGQGQQALAFYQQIYFEGVEPNPAYFVGVSIMALEEGRCVHEQIIQSGYKSDVFVGNCLIDMYAKCGSIEDAWRVFNRMAMHDVIAWSAMKCGQGHNVLELSQQMQSEGVQPDPGIFVAMLNACASVVALEEGFQVEKQIFRAVLTLTFSQVVALLTCTCQMWDH